MDLGYDDNMLNVIGGSDEPFESPGYLCRHDTALDLYCINLVDKPRKILSNIFFASSFDFSFAFKLLKRTITFFALVLYMPSYCQAWKPMLRSLTSF